MFKKSFKYWCIQVPIWFTSSTKWIRVELCQNIPPNLSTRLCAILKKRQQQPNADINIATLAVVITNNKICKACNNSLQCLQMSTAQQEETRSALHFYNIKCTLFPSNTVIMRWFVILWSDHSLCQEKWHTPIMLSVQQAPSCYINSE